MMPIGVWMVAAGLLVGLPAPAQKGEGTKATKGKKPAAKGAKAKGGGIDPRLVFKPLADARVGEWARYRFTIRALMGSQVKEVVQRVAAVEARTVAIAKREGKEEKEKLDRLPRDADILELATASLSRRLLPPAFRVRGLRIRFLHRKVRGVRLRLFGRVLHCSRVDAGASVMLLGMQVNLRTTAWFSRVVPALGLVRIRTEIGRGGATGRLGVVASATGQLLAYGISAPPDPSKGESGTGGR